MRNNEIVPIVASGFVHQGKINTGVIRASNALTPDVVRIRYSLGEDWSGSAAVFFRVVLTDNASRNRLRDASQRVASTVLNEVRPEQLGLQAYFNFRSVSEQEHLREESWA
jgi:hypothetical protein